MPQYDAVVVGAGNAGLISALTLLSKGKKTLLIEQHNIPGGCATSFVRGRFEFDPSLHELCGVGSEENPADVRKLFNSLGVRLNWCKVPDCFRVITKYTDGSRMDVTMPSGKDAFIDKMEYYVPGSRAKMEELFGLFDEICEATAYSSDPDYDQKVILQKYPDFLRTGAYSSMKVFKAMKLPQKCIDILSTYWSYLGVDMEHLSFIHYASMVNSYIRNSAYIPMHTSHEISVALTERIRELGGDIWFNCRAEKFLFDGDKCCGVLTSAGRVDCDLVFANINPDIIYGRMMPEELVPEREKKLSAARAGRYGARMFTCYFGLNKTAEELGINDYSIFMSGTSDSVKEYAALEKVKTNSYGIFLCYNICNPDFSPKGTCVVSITTMTGREDWEKLSRDEYFSFKTAFAKKQIACLKAKTGIDIAPYIEEATVATPLTFSRYLGVPEGSVYGYETRDWDSIIPRTMMLDADYTIKGLYPIGTSGPRGDGYSSAYAAGEIITELALKKEADGGADK